MTDRELIKKLQKMRQIKPDYDWALFCRQDLINRLTDPQINPINNLLSPINLINSINLLNQFIFAAFRLSPAKATVTMVIMLVMAGGVLVNLSQNALPGSAFYSLKLTSEDMAVKVVPGDENKLSLHTKFAERRVQEISALSRNAEVDAEALIPVLDGYKNRLASVNEILDSAINEGNGNAVKFAKKITKETEKYEASLSAVSGNLSQDLKKNFDAAVANTEGANLKTLTVLSSSTEENQEFVNKLREILEGKISALEASLENVEDEVVYAQLVSLLDEAKELLGEKDLLGALEAISAAEGLINILTD